MPGESWNPMKPGCTNSYNERKAQIMGKKVYTVNGKMYVVDDETGKIKTIIMQEDPIPQRDLEELIKILAQNQKDD